MYEHKQPFTILPGGGGAIEMSVAIQAGKYQNLMGWKLASLINLFVLATQCDDGLLFSKWSTIKHIGSNEHINHNPEDNIRWAAGHAPTPPELGIQLVELQSWANNG